MIILLSPAKTLNFDIKPQTDNFSQPDFTSEAETIVNVLRKYSPARIQKLMRINPKLAQLNASRYMEWHLPFMPDNARQALLVFKGEVYNGLKAESLTEADLLYAQDHLRILSGLYGVLRPLDLMQPYRLEMGTNLKVNRKKDMYHFWGDKLTGHLNELLEGTDQKYIINLASDEYFNAIDPGKLNAEIIKPVFKDNSNGTYKFITVYGKKARGLMARFIIKNRIEKAEKMKLFDEEGYYYNDQLTSGNTWVFTRG